MRAKSLFLVVFGWSLFWTGISSANTEGTLKKLVPIVQRKFVDVRDLLQRLSKLGNFSLMVDTDVRGNLEKVEGSTFEEILNKSVKPMGFEWRFWQGCLYVGETEKLENLWNSINTPLIPNSQTGRKVSLDLHHVEMRTLLAILKNYSEIGIQGTSDLTEHVTLRIVDMPWEQVLWGLVHMHGLRVTATNFSITVSPNR
jgi:hypothetical protein